MSGKFYPIATTVLLVLISSSTFSQSFSLLKDINPGVAGSSYFNFTSVGSSMFFRPDDGVHGDELWKSNGTPGGTVLVKDINPGGFGSELQEFVNCNGVLYFRADDGIHGSELWKSDGTAAGTVMVKDINPGINGSVNSSFYVSNGVLYFAADDGTHGTELWKSDGTEAGTVILKDIYPGVIPGGMQAGTPQSGNPTNFTTVDGQVFFAASAGDFTQEVWKTDGTPGGTMLVKDVYSGIPGYSLTNFINYNGILVFTVYSGGGGNELWKSDGTTGGTTMIKALPGGNFSNHPAVMNGVLYFLEADGLWKSDGTAAGTVLLKEKGGAFSFSPDLLTVINGTIFFTGNDDEHGLELWKSDGTAAGTVLLKDIYPGTSSSEINSFASIANKLMFTANDGVNGNELWISDGTASGTRLVQDIEPGSEGSMPLAFYEIKGGIVEGAGKIFTGATTAAMGNEVWTANVIASAPLPLELLEFKATLVGDNGFLEWKTENEKNSSVFIVERSTDAFNFTAIGTILASNTPGTHGYTYTDPNITSLGFPVIYYRLRQVDLDGRFTYSSIVAVQIEDKKMTIRLYPNPVQDRINLTITAYQPERLSWRFTDNVGRLIRGGTYNVNQGVNYISENVGFITTGVYFLQVFNNGQVSEVIKVMKE